MLLAYNEDWTRSYTTTMQLLKKIFLALIQFGDAWQGAFICSECGRIRNEQWRCRVEIGKEPMCSECYLKRAKNEEQGEFNGKVVEPPDDRG